MASCSNHLLPNKPLKRSKLVKYMPITSSNTLLLFVEKIWESFFSNKIISAFVISTFQILTKYYIMEISPCEN